MYYVLCTMYYCTMYIVFLTHGIKHFCIKYFMILNSDSKHSFCQFLITVFILYFKIARLFE